jgi:hypothetical protein
MLDLEGAEARLMPFTDFPAVIFDCAGARTAPVPIYVQGDNAAAHRLVLPSIGSLLEAWIELIDSGAWAVTPDGAWAIHPDKVPPALRDCGLA